MKRNRLKSFLGRIASRTARPRRPSGLEPLESRRLLTTIPTPITPQGQLFIYDLNLARHDPAAYQIAAGLTVDLSGVAPAMPLAVNDELVTSANGHATDMATNNYLAHQSPITGEWPNQMERDAGYPLPTELPAGPNSFYELPDDSNQVESIAGGYTTAAASLAGLITDTGINPPGHRIHLLAMDTFNQLFREVGVGYDTNPASTYKTYWSIQTGVVNETDLFLTGVVYNDANGNQQYDLNEGLPGVSVTADGVTVTTNAGGGWSIPVTAGTYTVNISGGGFVGTENISVTVTTANREVDAISGSDAAFIDFQKLGPTAIVLNNSSVPENQPAGTPVGTFTTTDAGDDIFTYTLVSGTGSTDNASFTIVGDTLETAASFNFEAKSSYTVRVRSTDQDGFFTEAALPITVTDVNEAPVINDQTLGPVLENGANGTLVGTVAASDPDTGQTLTYAITAGNTNGAFAINPANGKITIANSAALNFISPPAFDLTVQVTDNGAPPLSSSADVTIAVNPLTVAVGTGAAKSLTFTQADGTAGTLTLAGGGQAMLEFSGSGVVETTKASAVTLTGTDLMLTGIALTGTNSASTLTVTAKGGGLAVLLNGDITDAGALKAINAKALNVTGNITIADALATLTLGNVTNSIISIGQSLASPLASPPLAITLVNGDDVSLTSAIPIKSLTATSIIGGGQITAPTLAAATIKTDFESALTLTSAAGVTTSLGTFKAGGNAGGAWNITGGVKSVTAGSIGLDPPTVIGSVVHPDVALDNIVWSAVIAGDAGTWKTTGDMAGSLSALSAKSITVGGNLDGGTITFSEAPIAGSPNVATLTLLSVKGAIQSVNFASAGNVKTIQAGAIFSSNLFAGASPGLTVLPTSSADLPTQATIGVVKVTGIAGQQFGLNDSHIAAWSLGQVTLRFAEPGSGDAASGIAAHTILSLTYTDVTGTKKFSKPSAFMGLTGVGDLVVNQV